LTGIVGSAVIYCNSIDGQQVEQLPFNTGAAGLIHFMYNLMSNTFLATHHVSSPLLPSGLTFLQWPGRSLPPLAGSLPAM